MLIRSNYANHIRIVPTQRCRYGNRILVVTKRYYNYNDRNNVTTSYRQYDHNYGTLRFTCYRAPRGRSIHQSFRIMANPIAAGVGVTYRSLYIGNIHMQSQCDIRRWISMRSPWHRNGFAWIKLASSSSQWFWTRSRLRCQSDLIANIAMWLHANTANIERPLSIGYQILFNNTPRLVTPT